jgi:hypothetical protein
VNLEQAIECLYHIAYHPHGDEKHIREEARYALRELGEDLEEAEKEATKDVDEPSRF